MDKIYLEERNIGFPLSGVVYFNTIVFYIINKGYGCITIFVIPHDKKGFYLLSVIFFTSMEGEIHFTDPEVKNFVEFTIVETFLQYC